LIRDKSSSFSVLSAVYASNEIAGPAWGKPQHVSCLYQVADDVMQMDIHNTLDRLYTSKKMPYVTTATEITHHSSNASLRFHSCFFSNSITYVLAYR